MKTFNAFNGDPELKETLLEKAVQLRLEHEIVKRKHPKATFTRGSLIRTLHAVNNIRHKFGHLYDPIFLANQLGVPEFITALQGRIFEGLTPELSNHWTERFLNAIPVGVDLTPVLPIFLLSLLDGLPPQEGDVKAVIEGTKQLLIKLRETGQVDKKLAEVVAMAADKAADKAMDVAALARLVATDEERAVTVLTVTGITAAGAAAMAAEAVWSVEKAPITWPVTWAAVRAVTGIAETGVEWAKAWEGIVDKFILSIEAQGLGSS